MSRSVRAAAVVGAVVALLALAGGRSETAEADAQQAAAAKLRSDLAALVAGAATLDHRIPALVAGYREGELPYFALLTEPNDRAHEAQITPSAPACCAATAR